MTMEEPAVANAEYIGYGSPNLAVKNNAEYEEYMRDWHDAWEILYETEFLIDDYKDLKDIDSDKVKVSFYRAITDTEENGNLMTYTNDLWAEFKSTNAIPPWIIVADVLIVGSLVGLFVFFTVRRRMREKDY
jgi:hypothetical protein